LTALIVIVYCERMNTIDCTTTNLSDVIRQLVRTYGAMRLIRALRGAITDPTTRRLLARELGEN
jgi:hypothetical protein